MQIYEINMTTFKDNYNTHLLKSMRPERLFLSHTSDGGKPRDPRMTTTIAPPTISIVWKLSVHTTALKPPYMNNQYAFIKHYNDDNFILIVFC